MSEKFSIPKKTGPNRGPGDRGYDALEFRILKLELKPGDVLVVRADRILDAETMFRIRDNVQDFLPNNKVMMLSPGFELLRLTPSLVPPEKIEP